MARLGSELRTLVLYNLGNRDDKDDENILAAVGGTQRALYQQSAVYT